MIKRDYFPIDTHNFGNFFSQGPWSFKGETYHFLDEILETDDTRQSDQRLFMFKWIYNITKDKHEFGSFLTEVYRKGNSYE